MQLKTLLEDDDAVSPVIGVILMVAITVILAAVIGTFVLGLGDQVQQTSPTAQFSFDYDDTGGTNSNGLLTVTHDGGDGIQSSELAVNAGGNILNESNAGGTDWTNAVWFGSGQISAGDQAELHGDDTNFSPDTDTVRVLWNAPDGDRSSTLAEWEN